MEQSINTYVDTLFANMENFSQKDGLIGKPVIQGDKTFLPVMSITLGYGGGDTQSNANANTGAKTKGGGMSGGAVGIGAKLSTEAVIVIDNNNVLMAPLGGSTGSLNQVINKIPQIINSMSTNAQAGQNAQSGMQAQSGNTANQANKSMV